MNANLLPLLALLLKHTGEIPNIIAKGTAAATAITTKGVDKIDPVCELLQALKPLEADLIVGGFMAAHRDEASLRASYSAAGLLDKFDELVKFLEAHPFIMQLILKSLGL